MANKGKLVSFEKVGELPVDKNFDKTRQAFFELGPVALGLPTEATLATGDNAISVPIKRPNGCIVTYRSTGAVLFDKGLNSDGKWVINASAACFVKLIFIP